LGRQLGVRGFPSIFFIDQNGNQKFVYGSRPFESYEEAIQALLPEAQKQQYDKSWKSLFARFNSLTVKEFSTMAETDLSATEAVLEALVEQGHVRRVETRNGNLYIKL